MDYLIKPLQRDMAQQITTWQYDPPYQVYDLTPEGVDWLLDPVYRYHQVQDRAGRLVGFCCYGKDAQVPGGDYGAGEPAVLDVGVGLKPDLVGQGLGPGFVRAVLAAAREQYRPDRFRVTVADFNQRSMKTFLKLGFKPTFRLTRVPDGMPFTQMEVKTHEIFSA